MYQAQNSTHLHRASPGLLGEETALTGAKVQQQGAHSAHQPKAGWHQCQEVGQRSIPEMLRGGQQGRAKSFHPQEWEGSPSGNYYLANHIAVGVESMMGTTGGCLRNCRQPGRANGRPPSQGKVAVVPDSRGGVLLGQELHQQ